MALVQKYDRLEKGYWKIKVNAIANPHCQGQIACHLLTTSLFLLIAFRTRGRARNAESGNLLW